MTHEEFARIKSVHVRALSLAPTLRDDFLASQLSDAPDLLDECRRLLTCHEEAGRFLQTSLAERMLGAFGKELESNGIGPYEVIRELGRGGSATVYLARRADDLFQKQVAIKVMNRLAHSEEAFARFQREIQILALVEHSYFVRLLDAGTTGDALAYIVTEYVDGVRIDEFSAGRPLDQKLQLFLKVCEAVSAAHRALIVHRDLKPSNILVTPDGTPKVLDFGIAVLLDQDFQLTKTGLERMTVCYASPEQLRREKPITTASDVYSLGVLLYECISGEVPFNYPEHEITTRIENEDPPLLRGVPRELDAIARKALQRDPLRRYDSVDRFRDDVVRFIDGLPVEARGDSWLYRFGKYVRRHCLLVTAAAVAVALSVFSIIELREAKRQSSVVREVLINEATAPFRDSNYWTALRTRKMLQQARIPYLDLLALEYKEDWPLLRQPFDSRRALAHVLGIPAGLNLGETAEARRTLEAAVRVGEQLLRRVNPQSDFRRDVATTHLELGTVLLEMGDAGQAQREYARAEQLGGGTRVDLEALAQRSRILARRGRGDEALELRRRITSERRELYAKDPSGVRWEFAGSLCSLGELERELGRYAEAERSYAEALPMIEELGRSAGQLDNSWHLARENEEYARVLLKLGRRADAVQRLDRAVALYRQIRSREPDAMSNQRALAVCLTLRAGQEPDSRAAERELREALALSREAARNDRASVRAQQELAEIQRAARERVPAVE